MKVADISGSNQENRIVFGEPSEGVDYFTRKGVYGVALNRDGRVAVIRNPYGHWLPGGGLEEGEILQGCLIREFREELGCSISVGRYIGEASQYYYSEVYRQYRHPVGFFFTVCIREDTVKAIERDQMLLWMEPGECMPLLPAHQAWAVEQAVRYISIS